MHSHPDRYREILPSGSNGCLIGVIIVQPLRRNSRIYSAVSLDVLTGLACLTSGLRVPVRLGKQVTKLNITSTQLDPQRLTKVSIKNNVRET